MARFRHPNKRALQRWLDDEASTDKEVVATARVEQHIATCERCASAIESMSIHEDGNDNQTQASSIQQALGTVLASPDDLTERLEQKVTDRLDSRVMFDVVSDLFGAGVETSRLLLMEENDE